MEGGLESIGPFIYRCRRAKGATYCGHLGKATMLFRWEAAAFPPTLADRVVAGFDPTIGLQTMALPFLQEVPVPDVYPLASFVVADRDGGVVTALRASANEGRHLVLRPAPCP